MTIVEIPSKNGEIVTVEINWSVAKCDNAELQEYINAVLELNDVKPIVNIEPWTARVLIDSLGGKIVSEPEFDPNAGDVI